MFGPSIVDYGRFWNFELKLVPTRKVNFHGLNLRRWEPPAATLTELSPPKVQQEINATQLGQRKSELHLFVLHYKLQLHKQINSLKFKLGKYEGQIKKATNILKNAGQTQGRILTVWMDVRFCGGSFMARSLTDFFYSDADHMEELLH